MCLPDCANDNLDKPAITVSQSCRAAVVRGSRALRMAGGGGGSADCAPAELPGRGQRSPAVLSGAWYTAGKLGGSVRSPRGGGDNARNGPPLVSGGLEANRLLSAR